MPNFLVDRSDLTHDDVLDHFSLTSLYFPLLFDCYFNRSRPSVLPLNSRHAFAHGYEHERRYGEYVDGQRRSESLLFAKDVLGGDWSRNSAC